MIETLKYATISQICTKDLRFYNPDDVAGSKTYCQRLGITYLPDRNRRQCYELLDDKFVVRQLHEIEQCNPYDLIFSEATLAKFQKRNTDDVLFVTEDQRIKGVVHIVDYNREFIFTEFYKLIFGFETMLREYLISKGVNNRIILDYYTQKASGESSGKFWKNRISQIVGNKESFGLKQSSMGPLQIFYLSDLLNYYLMMGEINEVHKRSIIDIRNRIAHSVDIISQEKNEGAEHLYDFKGLKKFVSDALNFFENYDNLEEKVDE
jgi:hypothetical protein